MLRLRIVQAEEGDCLILKYGTPQDPRYMLIDGGPPGVFKKHLRAELARISRDGGRLNEVVLSHVDSDHVAGLLNFMTELKREQDKHQKPLIPIEALWHNTFIGTMGPDVVDKYRKLLMASKASGTRSLGGEMDTFLLDLPAESDESERGFRQGDQLSMLAGDLNVQVSQENPKLAPKGLICAEDVREPLVLGNARLSIIGPTRQILEELKKEWEDYLKPHKEALARAMDESAPNLSSIMFLVEADGKKILFTGDGRGDHVIQGLQAAGQLDANGKLHVDVLKVPHHGSSRNATREFYETVTADRYVISASGEYDNPDLATLNWIAETAQKAGRRIEIWTTASKEKAESLRQFDAAKYPGVHWVLLPAGQNAFELDLASANPAATAFAQSAASARPTAAGKSSRAEQPAAPAGPAPADASAKPKIQVVSAGGGNPTAKRALLVGINNFTDPTWRLRGCINDTADMQSLLTTYFTFKNEDVRILRDGDATAQGIRDGLAWLLSDYAGNDVRVFHFSSHGTQVADQSGDEWECKDEVIVPYDHSWSTPFRDDDLRAIFDPIPAGANFTFIADCCHSGSIQKALFDSKVEFTPRYLTPPPEVEDEIQSLIDKRNANAKAYVGREVSRLVRAGNVTPEELTANLGDLVDKLLNGYKENTYKNIVTVDKHVLLAGCEDKQTSADAHIEGTFRGAFTWALGKAIREANGNLTYGDLLLRAQAAMQGYSQTPQLECPENLRALRAFSPLT